MFPTFRNQTANTPATETDDAAAQAREESEQPQPATNLPTAVDEEDFTDDDTDDTGASSGSDSDDDSSELEENREMNLDESGSDSETASEGEGSELSEEDIYLPEVLHDTLVSTSGASIANIMEDISKSLAEIVKILSKNA